MKLVKITFLFFCFSISNFGKCKLNIFQEQDSIRHYYYLANKPQKSSDLPLAYKFYFKQKELSLVKEDTLQAIDYLRQVAIIQYKLGDYHASEESAVEALNLLDYLKTNDSILIKKRIGLYNQFGRIYDELLQYKLALEYYDKGLEIAITQSSINTIKNNKALIYRDQQKYDLAEKELLEVYQNSIDNSNLKDEARALDNLGNVQALLNRDNALEKLLKALEIRKNLNDLEGSYASYKHLVVYYATRDNKVTALYYANKGYEIAKSINAVSYVEDALSSIIDLNDDSKIKEYNRIIDSISVSKQISENKYALIKYNYLEQEKLAKESELQNVIMQKEKVITQGITAIIVLLSIFIYFFLRYRHKKDKLQQVYNTETRIAKKVHDEVANDVYHVMTKIQQENNKNNELLLDDLDDIYNKTRDISREHSIIDLSHDFKVQIDDLLISFKSEATNIITKNLSSIDWGKLSKMKKVTIYRVLQELLVNMKKHSKASSVIITFNQKGKKLFIDYADNGVGCELKKQNGLINTENRMHSINGTITFETETNKGFKAKIEI